MSNLFALRDLNKIILHCSATEEGRDVKVDTIRSWHLKRGWDDIGYHYCLYADGSIHRGRDIDKSGAHTKGENHNSIGVCYIGGLKDGKPADTMTVKQELAFMELVFSLRTTFGWLSVHGHNEYSSKACPSFVVSEKYKWINTK